MDATSETARIIAALCGITPAEVAQPAKPDQVGKHPIDHGFVIQRWPEEEGLTLLVLNDCRNLRDDWRVHARFNQQGKVRFESGAPRNEQFMTLAEATAHLKVLVKRANRPFYVFVIFERFAAANERLAADVPA